MMHVLIWIRFLVLVLIFILQNLGHIYDVIVDVAPELKWIPEDGYKSLKIVVYIDKEIDAVIAAEQELQYRLKALVALRIVTDLGLELGYVAILDISAATIEQDESTTKTIPSVESKEFQFDTEHGDRVLPNFLNSITGMKCGETKSFHMYFLIFGSRKIFRGVCAQFTKTCEQQLESLSSPKAVKNFLKNNRENITSIIKQNLAVGDIFKHENLQEIENTTAEFKQLNQVYDVLESKHSTLVSCWICVAESVPEK